MPKWGSQDYKKAVFEQLSGGSGGGGDSGRDEDHFQHFENFSAGAPRREVEQGVSEAFHPERLRTEDVEPQFRRAAEKMKPNERAEIYHDLMGELEQRGLAPSWLQKLLGLGSTDPGKASSEDVARLSEYSRQNHPEAFKKVVADKPFFVRWLDKPLVAALVGVIAGKMLNRWYGD
jgi:hypothetical protein